MDKRRTSEYLYNINSVYSLVTKNSGNRKIYEIILNKERENSPKLKRIISESVKKKLNIRKVNSKNFRNLFENELTFKDYQSSQGIMAIVSSYNYHNLDEYLESRGKRTGKLVILDGITDVGNFGSIIRNCCAFGASGIIISKNRSVSVNKRLSKISAGTLEEVRIYRVTNLVSTLKKLKKNGFWIYGTTLETNSEVKLASNTNFALPLAVVLGSEDKGISRLVSKNCDFRIKIDMSGRIQSLNVSTAYGILLYIIDRSI